MVFKGEGGRGGLEWEFQVSRYKLLNIEWIKKKKKRVLLLLLYHRELYSISSNKP